jgi:hypothetical protein
LEAKIQNDASTGVNHGEDNTYSLGKKLSKKITTWIFTLAQNVIEIVQKIKIKMAIT